MKIIMFGATGMVGQSVLREALLDHNVQQILAVGRKHPEQQQEKLRSIEIEDVADLQSIEHELIGFDACLFCLGVSSQGMNEDEYRRITHGITLSVGESLARLNPQMTFLYVSGCGTDSSEKGRYMWARVKGKTENDLMRLPFKAAYMFRPGFILPLIVFNHIIIGDDTNERTGWCGRRIQSSSHSGNQSRDENKQRCTYVCMKGIRRSSCCYLVNLTNGFPK